MENEPKIKSVENVEKKPKEITHYIYIKDTGEVRHVYGENSLKYKLKQIKDEGLEVEKVKKIEDLREEISREKELSPENN